MIAEIELLAKEFINREQQVLSVYMSVFEQCVSRSTSQQSSVVSSPAHTRQGSKKFPLRTLQGLVSNNDLRNKIFGSNHAPLSRGEGNNYFKKTCSNSTNV